MSPVIHSYDPPERFVAGTVGIPGSRTFYLQARTQGRVTSVALEKQQVQALAERIDALLDQVMRQGETRRVVPAMAPIELADNAPLESPVIEEFRAGTMTLEWDANAEVVVIEVFPFNDEVDFDDDGMLIEPEPEELLRVTLSAPRARAFVGRATLVVSAGRPACPFCGQPIDPDGHLCVRANGYRRRDP